MQGATRILIFVGVCLLFSDGFGFSVEEVSEGYVKTGDIVEGNPQAEPGPPINVKVTALSSSSLEVTWEPAPDSTPQYYRVLSHGSGIPPGDIIVYELRYRLVNLLSCTEYFISIVAVYPDSVEFQSEPAEGTTESEVPPMPGNCTIVKESSDSVSFSWAHPLTNCPVYNYNVSWLWEARWNGTLADEDWGTSGEMSYTIMGIRPYSDVLISIQGKTASGYGPALECEAQTKPYYPSAPRIVSITEGSNYLSVTWEPPEEPNGVIQHYRITRIGDDGQKTQETDGNDLTERLYNIAACQNYTLTVAAQTSAGFGAESNKRDIYVTGEAPLESVTCDGAASRNFTVMWDHGSVTCKDQYYYIAWNSTVLWSADKDQGETEVPGNETAYTFHDATPHTEYSVCVAITKYAEGSVCCNHTTAEDGPSAPTIKEISSFRGNVSISWSPPKEANGIVRNYNVSWESEDADPGTQVFEDVTEGEVVGPETCHTYAFSVSAGTVVWGNKSETREIEVVNYVDSMTCTAGGTGTVIAQYKFATQNCGFNKRNTNWKVLVLWNNNTWSKSASDDSSPAIGSYTVSNLDPYSQVEVCMSVPDREEEKACCSATTNEAVPDEPSKVLVSNVTNTTARIFWTRPLHVNGAIRSWEVTLRGVSNDEETEYDVEGKLMSFDATDLIPSTDYEAIVKCETGGGLGKGTRSTFRTLNPDNSFDNQPNLGLIIGLSVAGGIIVLLLVAAGVVQCLRQKRKRRSDQLKEEDHPQSHYNNGFGPTKSQ